MDSNLNNDNLETGTDSSNPKPCAFDGQTLSLFNPDYPFLYKIFQILFSQQDFSNYAFFNADQPDIPNSKPILYQLIIRQLLQDGYASVAETLQKKIDPTVSAMGLSPENTLHHLFKILFYIELRSQTDSRFSNLLNWFLSQNIDCHSLGSETEPPSQQNESLSIMDSTLSAIYESDSEGTNAHGFQSSSTSHARPLQVVYKFGQIGDGPGCLDTPHGFCLGVQSDIVIADTNNHRICVFTLQGQFKFSFGEYGTDVGKLHQPRKIAMMPPVIINENDDPVFIVCDRGTKRSRMQMFSVDGEFIRVIEIPPMDIVSGLTTTQDRRIIVVDSVRSGVLVMNDKGMLLNWFSCAPNMIEPSDVAVHNKNFYICDFKGHCVNVYDSHGILIKSLKTPMLKFPNGIDVSDDGQIICGDSHGNRFHVSLFSSNGDFISDYDCPFVKVSRCCGLRLAYDGLIVTLAKNNNHAVVMNSISLP